MRRHEDVVRLGQRRDLLSRCNAAAATKIRLSEVACPDGKEPLKVVHVRETLAGRDGNGRACGDPCHLVGVLGRARFF